MKILYGLIMAFFVTKIAFALPLNDDNQGHSNKRYSIKGTAVTGANIRLGEPVWDMGEGLGTTGFSFVHGYNPSGPEPLDLTPDTPKNTVLATGLDENFLQALGLNIDDFNPNPVNIPFHQVPIIVNPFTAERIKVGPGSNATGPTPSRSGPNEPITLKKWLAAKGRVVIHCHADNTSSIRFKLKGLIPNGVYTVWALFGDDVTGDGIEDRILPAALGGVPNIVIPNRHGKAKFMRKLGYCPMQDNSLKLIDVTYHSDGNVYGGTVDLFLPGFPGFAVTNTHVAFPINAEPLN